MVSFMKAALSVTKLAYRESVEKRTLDVVKCASRKRFTLLQLSGTATIPNWSHTALLKNNCERMEDTKFESASLCKDIYFLSIYFSMYIRMKGDISSDDGSMVCGKNIP